MLYNNFEPNSLGKHWQAVIAQRGPPSLLAKRAGSRPGDRKVFLILLDPRSPKDFKQSSEVTNLIAIWTHDDYPRGMANALYNDIREGRLLDGTAWISLAGIWAPKITVLKFDEKGKCTKQANLHTANLSIKVDGWTKGTNAP